MSGSKGYSKAKNMRMHVAPPFVGALLVNTGAFAFTYSDWSASTEKFKQGYVFALLEYRALVIDAEDHDQVKNLHWKSCLKRLNSISAARYVEAHVLQNPTLMKDDMLPIVLNSFAKLCGPPPK